MLRSLDRDDSDFNEGWRYWVSVGAAILLLGIKLILISIIIGVLL